MPARKATSSGKWSQIIWDVTPAIGDDVYANGNIVEIDQSINVGSLRTAVSGSYAVAGGGFTLYQPLSVIASPNGFLGGTTTCLTTYVSSGTLFLSGNVLGGTTSTAYGISNNSTSDTTLVGNVSGSGSAIGLVHNSAGKLFITASNIQGGTAASCHGVSNLGFGNLYITGNCLGGTNSTAYSVYNNSAGAVLINGNITAGSNGAGVFQNSTGTLFINGTITASVNANGIVSTNTAARNEFTGSLVNDISGRQAAYCIGFLLRPQMFNSYTRMAGPSSTNTPVFYYAPESYSVTYVPHTSSVRAGVTYAAVSALSGVAVNIPTQLIGTMHVPSPASVSYNVPVESTTGTGIVSPASLRQLWSVSLDNIKTSNSLGTRLKNVATIQEVGDLLAYGSITITPDTISGLQLWLDATNGLLNSTGTLVTTNGELIATWLDRSGNNRHATQAINGTRPILLTNALNGKNCAFFDGTKWMQGISFPNLTNYTMFAVYRRKGTPGSGSGFVFCTGVDGNSADTARLTQLIYHESTAPSPAPGYNAFGWPAKITPSNNYDIHLPRNDNFNIHSCTASLASGTAEYRLNSTGPLGSISPGAVSTSTGSMIYTLGTKTWGQTEVNFMANCDIAEIIVYNTTFNTSQRQLVETYLNNKWGIY